jgi:hypothetical protein
MVSKSLFGSVILTASAVVASWPTTVFLLQYYANLQNSGALWAGSFFSVLSGVFWVSAAWGWLKTWKTRYY